MKIKPKIGDLFLIELEGEKLVVGLVLHISKTFKQSMIVGFFDKLIDSSISINAKDFIDIPFYDTPNYTGTKILSEGDWTLIGHYPELVENREIPLLRASFSIYYKDKVVKTIDRNQLKDYVQLLGQGKVSVENKLRNHFGLDEK